MAYCFWAFGEQHCLASMDPGLEVFSRNPTDDRFVDLAFQLTTFTEYLSEVKCSPHTDFHDCHNHLTSMFIRRATNLSHGLNPAHWWVNSPTLWDVCVSMIGRANMEGSRSNVAVNAWLRRASYPRSNLFGHLSPQSLSSELLAMARTSQSLPQTQRIDRPCFHS